jgi:ATP-dependent DNA ligase
VSGHGVDHTRRFSDIAAAVAKLSARTAVLDGEVAIYDQQLRSRFDCLREPDRDAIASPPLFIAAAEGVVTVLTPRGSGGMA